MNAGESFGSVIFQALEAIEASTSADFAAAKAQLANKAAVAEYYSVELGKSSDSLEALQPVVANVTNNPASVQAAKDALDPVQTFTLTEALAAEELPELYNLSDATANFEAQTVAGLPESVARAEAIVAGATNAADLELSVAYTLSDTLENLAAADAAVLEGAASYSLTDEAGDLGSLTKEQIALVQGATNAADFTNGTIGETFTLIVGADTITGTAGNDLFKASVVQNLLGEQTNSLATGDHIDGGAGQDSLFATVQQASALNQGPASAIMPSTVSVETVEFRALADNNEGEGSLANDRVVINAKDMLGVETLGSVHSDASLLIKDVTTLTNNGEYADKRETGALTVRMDHTGNGNAVDRASDLTVLIDNDYLIPTGTSSSVANYWLLDEDADLANSANRLNAIDNNGLSFTLGGVAYSIFAVEDPATELFSGTHEAYVAALQANLAAQQAAGTIPADLTVTLDYGNTRQTGLENGALSKPIPAIVVSSTSGVLVPTGFARPENTPGEYDVYGRFDNEASATSFVTVNVELEKVGRGAEGGDLTIGGMATDQNLSNNWDYSGDALKEGVEQFNVTVSGDATQNSSLASLQSTNNTLQIVNVVSAEGSQADLFIGNLETVRQGKDIREALKDVRVFNATGFENDLTLNASLTDEVVAKYLDLDDTDAAHTADNSDFAYNFAGGNDVLNINISKTNLAFAGTTTREDFTFTANMGAGNDVVTAQIGNGVATSATDAWYVNNTLNNNLTIQTGLGDDTVSTLGSGTWTIDVGTGNDTVYSDNSGARATWVFNTDNSVAATAAAARNIFDLRSDANDTYGSLFKSTLTVTFRGITTEVTLDATVDTDLDINQVIKAAINSDPVLSKLLLAQDGPANTLVVQSLVDGAVLANDLAVNITAPTAAAFDQTALAEYATALGLPLAGLSAAGLQAQVAANVATFNATGDYTSNFANFGVAGTELTGSNSAQISQSEIRVDLDGTDVIALSTGANSAETIILEGVQDLEPLVVVNYDALSGDSFMYANADGSLVAATLNATGTQVGVTVDGVWTSVADVILATDTGIVPPPPGGQTDVDVANGVVYDASTDAFNYIIDFSLTPKEDWAAEIAGFGDDDTVTVINAGGAAQPMFGTQPAATDFDFAYVLNDYSASWTLTMTGQDAALVADVLQGAVGGVVAGAAADAAVVELAGVWGADWLNIAS